MFSLVYLILKYPETRWSWDKKREKIKLPDSFIWGTATASHQVEGGCTNNNWFKWESCKDKGGKPRIKDGQEAGDACNHWNLYKEDIELSVAYSKALKKIDILSSKLLIMVDGTLQE